MFATHPVHTESVSNITGLLVAASSIFLGRHVHCFLRETMWLIGRADVLQTFFYLLGFCCYATAVKSRTKLYAVRCCLILYQQRFRWCSNLVFCARPYIWPCFSAAQFYRYFQRRMASRYRFGNSAAGHAWLHHVFITWRRIHHLGTGCVRGMGLLREKSLFGGACSWLFSMSVHRSVCELEAKACFPLAWQTWNVKRRSFSLRGLTSCLPFTVVFLKFELCCRYFLCHNFLLYRITSGAYLLPSSPFL